MTVQREEKLPHILVIDDEEGILMTLRLYLQDKGYRVSTVENTEAARQLLATDEPDVILSDVMMPGEDGLSFLAYVHQCLPDMPVVIMTGCAQLQTAINAVKHGAFDFIQKPFDFDYLNKLIGKAVEYSTLRRMEKRYRAELEETVALRTNELKTAMTQLETTSALLLKAASEKSEFISTITHEMRTPMNGVIGALDLLTDSDLAGSQKEFVLLARQAADNMVALINQLLSFSAFSGNSLAVCHEVMHLPDLLETLKRKYLPCFFKKGIAFRLQISPETYLSIRCDVRQLSQLLDILLANALKFTDCGEVHLIVAPELSDKRRASIHFCVKDSGIGIPEEMLERIFEPFIQVDGSLTRRYGGTGLGLSIARQIARLIGGKLWAESVLGEGSCFHLSMTAELVGKEAVDLEKNI